MKVMMKCFDSETFLNESRIEQWKKILHHQRLCEDYESNSYRQLRRFQTLAKYSRLFTKTSF